MFVVGNISKYFALSHVGIVWTSFPLLVGPGHICISIFEIIRRIGTILKWALSPNCQQYNDILHYYGMILLHTHLTSLESVHWRWCPSAHVHPGHQPDTQIRIFYLIVMNTAVLMRHIHKYHTICLTMATYAHKYPHQLICPTAPQNWFVYYLFGLTDTYIHIVVH